MKLRKPHFLFILLSVYFYACSNQGTNTTEIENIPLEEDNISTASKSSSLWFTEIDPINVNYKDEDGDDAPWVEIFNNSDKVINLSGMSLTDSYETPAQWTFGDVSISPYSTIIVYLSGKNVSDYETPHDSTNLIGTGCWVWTDSQNSPIKGESTFNPLTGKSGICFSENEHQAFGGLMQYGENKKLGWHSISAFVGVTSSNPKDYKDISKTNQLLLTGFIEKDKHLELRLAQPDLDDWKGWAKILTGTGDSNTTYEVTLPTNSTLPNLSQIYGTRFSPETNELRPVSFKITSYIARNSGHNPHANFKIKNTGGKIFLFNSQKELLDSVSYPELPLGKTWSYNGSSWGYANPNPNDFNKETNVAEKQESLNNIASIPVSGFYQIPFTVTFENTSGITRCEKGGKIPTENSPIVNSLQISETTTLRCAVFPSANTNSIASEVMTRTYIFEEQPKTPIVFLTADPNSLFDPDTGIYVEGNYAQSENPHFGANYWQDKEIPVYVEFFENGVKTEAFGKNGGLKIFGNYSRANAKKSVAITFREKYGDKHLNYTLFPDFPRLKKFKVFILRNNGGNYGADYIRDRLCSSVTEGLDVDYQRGRGVVVYYNGEYYGIHSIRERSTEYYFETHYGLDPNEIDLLKADNSATAGSSTEYVALMNELESFHLTSDKNFEYVKELIDTDNFMNYVQTEIFMNNRDWPANNLKKWRGTNPKTKWKWFLYDLDFGFGNEFSEYKNNIFEFATEENGSEWPNGPASTLLLRRLLENENYKTAFINRMTVLLSMNFESSRLLARMNTMMAEIESEISRDQKRWNHNASYMSSQLEKMKTFAKTRQAIILSEMTEFFNLSKTIPVTLSVTGSGKILVHNLPLDRTSMTISFFEGMPITLTAKGNGGVFTGWSDGLKEETRIIYPEEISELSAIFK